jgi:7-keto-8-aminopelargonate synthetase-like enzyme
MRRGLKSLGYSVGNSRSQIIPVIIGDEKACMRLSEELLARGVFAQGIRPPTVPPGTSRLRMTLMATHTTAQIKTALETLRDIKEC